jgi:hypothetical protein
MGGCHPLTFASIDTYARRHEIDGEAFELLRHVIQEMDGVYVEHINKRAEEENGRRARERRDR